MYSLGLQHELFARLRPAAAFNDGERFLSPPPFAWLVLLLSAFGPAVATYAWLAISLAALVATWWLASPPGGRERVIWLLGALAWYPVLYSLSLAQPDLVIAFAVAACWRLTVSGRQYLAGAVLGLSMLKPQLTLLLPLVLLTSGRWRVTAAWAAVAAVLAAASLTLIGPQGLTDYRSLLAEAQHVTNNRYFTLAYFVGAGTLSYVMQAVVAVAAATAAYLNRKASHERIFALGLVATALGSTYWHLQDYAILVPAAWLFWRTDPPAWQRWGLLLVVVAGELAWPLKPWPILLGLAIWFVCLAIPRQPRLSPHAAAAPAAL